MRCLTVDWHQEKGWFLGPWDSPLPIAIGYANTGIQENHLHQEMVEIYLVARGHTTAVVNGEPVPLRAGQILVAEPGEIHTFKDSADDYLHFVIQTPFVAGDKHEPYS